MSRKLFEPSKQIATHVSSCEYLDLMKNMALLKGLGDVELASWSRDDLKHLNSANDARNQSMLAHRHWVVGSDDVGEMQQQVERLLYWLREAEASEHCVAGPQGGLSREQWDQQQQMHKPISAERLFADRLWAIASTTGQQ